MNTPHIITNHTVQDLIVSDDQLQAQLNQADKEGQAIVAQQLASNPDHFKKLLHRYTQAKQDIKLLRKYAEDPLPDDQMADLSGETLPSKLNKAQIIQELHTTLNSFHRFITHWLPLQKL